ncbi:MAG TPA: hypothetical protein VFZ98_07060 [Vicinamibacterales bacterium]
MDSNALASEFRFEKRRADAIVTVAGAEPVRGCFFTAAGTTRHSGGERIGDLLNAETGFFPFETQTESKPRTMLFNRAHVITVEVFDDEARRDPGYAVAVRRDVSILLSNGQRLTGEVRVYRPDGHNRLSDWTHQPERFRYLETRESTLLINAAHIVAVTEVSGS